MLPKPSDSSLKTFGLYIHWPFCLKKCPYCDFNSYVFEHEANTWVDGLVKEIQLFSHTFKNYKIETIFFGGGTPSLIPPVLIKKILEEVNNHWPIDPVVEITLETNPSSLECHNLEEFMNNGINRFSIGMQSLNDDNLQFLGRLHNSQEAIKILEYASKICNNVSGDFIYSLPHDTLASWKKDLDRILNLITRLNIKHCSLYQLVIEPNTGFELAVKSKKWIPMNDDMQSVLYRYTHKRLNQMNWNYYEISNAAMNDNFRCQHNLKYWNYENYLGIGPGAHSRAEIKDKKFKFNNFKNPIKWLEKVNEQKNTDIQSFDQLENIEELNQTDQLTEKLLMGLRLTHGIVISQSELNMLNQENFELLKQKGFIKQKENNISLSLNGRLKLNSILNMILK